MMCETLKAADVREEKCSCLPRGCQQCSWHNFISSTERLYPKLMRFERLLIAIVLNNIANVMFEFGKQLIAANQGE